MGLSPFKSCYTNSTIGEVPNPDPSRWSFISVYEASNAYVLRLKYHDCTNFEGEKILVFEGRYMPVIILNNPIDPHFSQDQWSPIARFRPTDEGWMLACSLADRL